MLSLILISRMVRRHPDPPEEAQEMEPLYNVGQASLPSPLPGAALRARRLTGETPVLRYKQGCAGKRHSQGLNHHTLTYDGRKPHARVLGEASHPSAIIQRLKRRSR